MPRSDLLAESSNGNWRQFDAASTVRRGLIRIDAFDQAMLELRQSMK